MDERDRLAESFEAHRGHMRAVAYRMLGSATDADDAVQEAWLRLSRTDNGAIDNLRGWLTTVVARVSLDMLRGRRSRPEGPYPERLPDPIVTPESGLDPEYEALVADSVGLALLVVLQTLSPAERLAFVLHDMFAVPFDDIARIVDRSPDATRQLASRARRRVRGAPEPDTDRRRQRELAEAFLTAASDGDFARLLEVLDPNVVLRVDQGAALPVLELRGAQAVARQASGYAHLHPFARPIRVNGTAGFLVVREGRPLVLVAYTGRADRIVEIDIIADPDRLEALGLPLADG
ncbi:MAG TPA: sigma-70 family RNA polymerase sigma factor [Solirubrobacteraceae bacterium]|nr:sigma-70 family RNA polymerase sigma factor [Solirubrobacteraceae bacterium]